jgi:hypothetical protein
MSLKSLKIVQNALHYWKKPPFLLKCKKKSSDFLKSLNPTKMYLKSLAIFEKPSHQLKKALNLSEMSSKKNEIFKKASNHFKNASNSLKKSLKCHAFFKKSLAFSKMPQ